MSIYTRSGDSGTTSLADGTRVSKASLRVEAYGTVDETNSLIGLARAASGDVLLDDVLHFCQQRLFNCSSSLAMPEEHRSEHTPVVSAKDVQLLEGAIDRFETKTGSLDHFILEAGDEVACRLQVARAAARRAERRLVALAEAEPIDSQVQAFVNRLSDLLFAAARYANAIYGTSEEQWDQHAPRPLL